MQPRWYDVDGSQCDDHSSDGFPGFRVSEPSSDVATDDFFEADEVLRSLQES